MNEFLEKMVRNRPDAGGGAQASTPSAAAGDGSTPPAGPAPSQLPTPSAGEATPAGPAAPVDLYRPDGLPDHMTGKTDRETMDNIAKALKGYRERDSLNEIPKDAASYSVFPADLPETVKPHIETLTNDKLFARVAEKAHALKIPPGQFQALTAEMMGVAAEMGLMEPPINVEAERAALVPDNARHLSAAEQWRARELRMSDNFAYLDQLANRGAKSGGLDKDTVDFAKAMLGDSAKGHVFIEHLRGQSGGGLGPVIANGGAVTGNGREELTRRAALPENTWGHPQFNQGSYEALLADRKKFHAD